LQDVIWVFYKMKYEIQCRDMPPLLNKGIIINNDSLQNKHSLNNNSGMSLFLFNFILLKIVFCDE
jgi:hypothetical protein